MSRKLLNQLKLNKKFKLKLTILQKHWIAEGDTIQEALENFKLSWKQIKGKGALYITDGTNEYIKLLSMGVLRRIFVNKIARAYWIKNLELLVEE